MAYATGSAGTVSAFLSALGTFAAANGWTQDEWDSGNLELHLHKGSIYLVVKGFTSGSYAFYVRGATGYASGSAWNAQPGISGYDLAQAFTVNSANLFDTGTNYYFFTNTSPDMLYAVAVNSVGGCGHIVAAELTKRGTWTGGYFYGGGAFRPTSRSTGYSSSYEFNCALRCEHYSQTWMGPAYTYKVWDVGLPAVTSAFSNLSPLLPMEVAIYNSAVGSEPVGYLPHLRAVHDSNYDPADEIVIGSDIWMVFPRTYRGHYPTMATAVRKVT